MYKKTKKRRDPIPVYRDENGMLIHFLVPFAATEWGDNINFREYDNIQDTIAGLSEAATMNEN